jgi:4-amino-4-deoxy-L-arabinose transferase-like glycosyltransferase
VATEKSLLTAVLIVAFTVRVAVALLLPDQGFVDAHNYREAGQQFWEVFRIGKSHMMPLYPILVGLVGGGFGQIVLDALLSTAAVWLVYALSLKLFSDRAAAFTGALAAAFYPYFIFYSAVGLTEPLFIALLLAAFLAWYRGAFIAAAIFTVFGILTRPAIELLAPLLVCYFAFFLHGLGVKGTARQLLVYAAVYLALMSPWWVHNYATYGTFVRLDLATGIVLRSANNPMNESGGSIFGKDWDPDEFSNITDPVARDRALREAAIAYIEEHPVHFAEMALIKFTRFWQPWPYASEYKGSFYLLVSLLSYGPILLLSLAYLVLWGRQDLRKILPILMFIAYLTAVHCVVVSSIRYRLPIEPFLIIFASVAVTRIARGAWKPSNPMALKSPSRS